MVNKGLHPFAGAFLCSFDDYIVSILYICNMDIVDDICNMDDMD
jgi:hypothetical protein